MPCEKVQFSKKDAKTRLNELRRDKTLSKRPQRIYYCPECGFWHLSSSGKYGTEK